MRFQMRSPAFLLTAFVVIIIAATGAVLYFVLSRPFVNLPIDTTARPFVTMEEPGGKRAILGLLAPDTVLPSMPASRMSLLSALEGYPRKGIYFQPDDFVEDPDMLTSYPAVNRFVERQAQMNAMVQPGRLVLATADADGSGPVDVEPVKVDEWRPIATLPLSFWLQLGSGLIVILIAAFFLALRPRSFAVSALAFAGLGITGAAYAAAIYSSRQFGMDAATLMLLSEANHVFTMSFGFGIIALFAQYPVRLVDPFKLLAPIVALGLIVMVTYRLQVLPHDLVILQNMIALLLLIILAMIGWQYRATRGNPADRAALLWLGLSVIFGSAAFVLLVTLPVSLGYQGIVTQAVGFVLLCMIYIGTAFAVSRYRLFDIGRWSYRIFFYTGVIIALLALDFVFVAGLQISAHTSLAVASVVALFGYLPFRDYVYDRFLNRQVSDLPGLYRRTVAVAYQFGAADKEAAWIEVLKDVFRPGHVEKGGLATDIRILNEGIELSLPAFSWSGPLTLGLAVQGRRLFNRDDVEFVRQLANLVRSAEADRLSYEKGAKEERHRIARDLHDEVGATLLSGLHSTSETQRQESIADALADIRQISKDLAGQDVVLERFIGQLRHEARERAELHGRPLEWPLGDADGDESVLPYRFHRSLSAMLREALSNALAHGSGPIRVATNIDGGNLTIDVSNSTVENDPSDTAPRSSRGQGAPNIRARAEDLGGRANFTRSESHYATQIVVPLPQGVFS